MNDSAWLVVKKTGIQRIVKGNTRQWARARGDIPRPRLEQGEYAVLISVIVPDTAFKPIGLPTATITVPEHALIAPKVDVDVMQPPPEERGAEEAE